MALEPKANQQLFVKNPWVDMSKGLRKEIINSQYSNVVQPNEFSKCFVDILSIENLHSEKHKTNYLLAENIGKEITIEIGHAVTPIDCYVELFLKQMFLNETSKCSIATKSSGTIEIIMRLKKIEFGGYYFEQPENRMYDLAKLYKENGVKMFKEFPLFAHNYFNLAAKCLLSVSTLHDSETTLNNFPNRKDFEVLLHNIYLNIAACLNQQQRYEDTIHVLKFCISQDEPSEKTIYRLALAHFNLKQFEDAKSTIERINYKNNKELVLLMTKVQDSLRDDRHQYSNMIKKMFV